MEAHADLAFWFVGTMAMVFVACVALSSWLMK